MKRRISFIMGICMLALLLLPLQAMQTAAEETENTQTESAQAESSEETENGEDVGEETEKTYETVSDLLETVQHNAYVNGSDGKFYPNSAITRAEAAQMFYNLLRDKTGIAGKSFQDVKAGKWYYDAVSGLAGLAIIKGVTETTFSPNRAITREEFVTMAARFAKLETGENMFSDVAGGMWAYEYILSATAKGWIKGYTDKTFRPKNNITRAEAVTVINRMLGRVPDANIKSISIVKTFQDLAKTHWAYGQISEASTTHTYSKNQNGSETWIVDENDTRTWYAVPGGFQCKGLLTGELKTGFQAIEGQVYYFDPQTKLLKSGWQKIDGKTYLLAAKGEQIPAGATNTLLTQVNYTDADRTWQEIGYIAVHYTAVPGDTAKQEAQAFYSKMMNASAHYFVDETSIWQVVKDSDVAWHVGNNTYTHEAARNKTAIGIEMCTKKSNTASMSAYDADWFFHVKTEEKTAELVRGLMKKYAVPIEDVIRHADVTQKVCPAPYVNKFTEWQRFLRLVTRNEISYGGEYSARVTANITVYAGPGTGYKTVGGKKVNDVVTVYEERMVAKNAEGRWVRIGADQWIQITKISRK